MISVRENEINGFIPTVKEILENDSKIKTVAAAYYSA